MTVTVPLPIMADARSQKTLAAAYRLAGRVGMRAGNSGVGSFSAGTTGAATCGIVVAALDTAIR